MTATSKCRLFTATGGPYPDGLACYSPEPSKLADVHARHKRRQQITNQPNGTSVEHCLCLIPFCHNAIKSSIHVSEYFTFDCCDGSVIGFLFHVCISFSHSNTYLSIRSGHHLIWWQTPHLILVDLSDSTYHFHLGDISESPFYMCNWFS